MGVSVSSACLPLAKTISRMGVNSVHDGEGCVTPDDALQSLATVVAALEEHRKHLQADSAGLMEVCETMGTENRRLQQQARVCPRLIKSKAHILSMCLPATWGLLIWPDQIQESALKAIRLQQAGCRYCSAGSGGIHSSSDASAQSTFASAHSKQLAGEVLIKKPALIVYQELVGAG